MKNYCKIAPGTKGQGVFSFGYKQDIKPEVYFFVQTSALCPWWSQWNKSCRPVSLLHGRDRPDSGVGNVCDLNATWQPPGLLAVGLLSTGLLCERWQVTQDLSLFALQSSNRDIITGSGHDTLLDAWGTKVKTHCTSPFFPPALSSRLVKQ